MSMRDVALGAATGSWMTVVAFSIGTWLGRRRAQRRSRAQAKALAVALQNALGGPTPGCTCEVCEANRAAAVTARGAN